MNNNTSSPVIFQSILQQVDSIGNQVLTEQANEIVKKHALLAMGASFIPVPGASLAALYANDLYMFKNLNDCLGITFSGSQIKTIIVAIATELGAFWLAKKGAFEMVKFLPMMGALAGGMLRAASEAAEVYVVAAIYYHILARTNTGDRGMLDDAALKEIVKDCMAEKKEELKDIFLSAKQMFKKVDKSEIKDAEKEIRREMEEDKEKEYLNVVQAVQESKKEMKPKSISASESMKCPNCGTVLRANTKFCEECGAKL